MLPEDIPAVYSLANRVHTLYESIDIFIERQKLCPEGCFVLGDCVGYAISHPYLLGAPPLNTCMSTLPNECDCWYIHDIVILPEYRDKGYASILLSKLTELAKHSKTYLTLTSVNETTAFWRHLGFQQDDSIQCSSYGVSCFMKKAMIKDMIL